MSFFKKYYDRCLRFFSVERDNSEPTIPTTSKNTLWIASNRIESEVSIVNETNFYDFAQTVKCISIL